MADVVFKVMVSSSFRDLRACRQAVRDAILGQAMLPLMMETDAAVPDRGIISNSFAKVDEADAYVVLISNFRYGQVIDDEELNPQGLSVTELEFARAEARKLPICVFLMDENVPVSPADMRKELAWTGKLDAFRARARHHSRIAATFTTEENLRAQVTQTLSGLREVLKRQLAISRSTDPASAPGSCPLPAPPAFVAEPPYVPGHAFRGRNRELGILRAWANSSDPVLVFEAIGGMGKSMVTWEWVTNHATQDRTGWAGRLWYSFYERGADMRDFKITALAYMTGQAPETFRSRPEAELTRALLDRLGQAPWLLVLDGLERVLAAYHRSDAAQLRDDQVQADGETGLAGREPRDCIRPDDHDLLFHLAAAAPSKLLISSRLMPRALLNAAGLPFPGVERVLLQGLAPEDAEAMLTGVGIRGDSARMRRYLAQAFDCHPLVVGFVAGLVRKSPWAEMSFDRWADDPRGGAAVNLTDPDLRQRQTNILKLAFDVLEPPESELLARIGMLANATEFAVLEALNPLRPDPPMPVSQPIPPNLKRDSAVRALKKQLRATSKKKKKARKRLKRGIAERRAMLTGMYARITQAYANYQVSLEAYKRAQREASEWLDGALIDLEGRGLLQWDRTAGTFDLHPVVRGYAVGALSPEARTQAGQRVADLFAARAEPDYGAAASLSELADRIQVAQALSVARKPQQAWKALWPETLNALHRLECHYDRLALLRLLFPNGWALPPEGVRDLAIVAREAAGSLRYLGRWQEQQAQTLFAIRQRIPAGLNSFLGQCVSDHYICLSDRNHLARAARALDLFGDISAELGDQEAMLWHDAYLVNARQHRGELEAARSLLTDMAQRPAWRVRHGRLEAQCLFAGSWLLYRENALTAAYLREAIERVQELGERFFERWLWHLAGNWHQSAGEDTEAAAAFGRAIEMARAVALSDTNSEIQRGLSLARLGRRREAEAVSTADGGNVPHISLAELNLELGQRDAAREHVRPPTRRLGAMAHRGPIIGISSVAAPCSRRWESRNRNCRRSIPPT
jgi:tetratricopeptide (TPR) repeat protein